MREKAKGSIFFSSFVAAVDWTVSLLLSVEFGHWLDCQPSHQRSGIDKQKGCY